MRHAALLACFVCRALLPAQNVGIGIATPAARLEVYDHSPTNAAVGGRLRLSAGANTQQVYVDFMPDRARTGGAPAQIIGIGTTGGSARLTFWTAPDNATSASIERMRIEPNGDIFGRFRHVSYHKFHNQSWTGNPANTILWFAAGGGDATDDIQVNGALPVGGPGSNSEARAQWVVPYNGRIVRVVVRVGNWSGSTPTIRTRGLVLSRNGTLSVINPNGFCLSEDQAGVYECTQNCAVSRGDRVSIGFDLRTQSGGCCGGNCYAEDTHYWVAVVWAFDMWD